MCKCSRKEPVGFHTVLADRLNKHTRDIPRTGPSYLGHTALLRVVLEALTQATGVNQRQQNSGILPSAVVHIQYKMTDSKHSLEHA